MSRPLNVEAITACLKQTIGMWRSEWEPTLSVVNRVLKGRSRGGPGQSFRTRRYPDMQPMENPWERIRPLRRAVMLMCRHWRNSWRICKRNDMEMFRGDTSGDCTVCCLELGVTRPKHAHVLVARARTGVRLAMGSSAHPINCPVLSVQE